MRIFWSCTDIDADNYSLIANQDDQIRAFITVVYLLLNFDVEANDDGTCEYFILPITLIMN